ncbi:chromosome segregation in meiosis- protein [Xylographa opegraphella]|nr:chromosome segregation in meiosis- protein [Xylographa opegraphella]
MPAPTSTTTSLPPPGDDLDDLFNYDVETDDVFRDYNPAMDAPVQSTTPPQPKATDLGIDEEIQVTKKRKPIAKLDETRRVDATPFIALLKTLTGPYRLLSQAGIPKLRRITKERLRFKGKGHEYSDAAQLLNLYQLWLDDLYPRAKFADGLAMIEKLGHSKRLQTMRREWIKEGKPLEARREDEASSSEGAPLPKASAAKGTSTEESAVNTRMAAPKETASLPPSSKPATSTSKNSKEESLFVSDDELDTHPSDDELDALFAENAPLTNTTVTTLAVPTPYEAEQHASEDDELDALLAEDTFKTRSAPPPTEKHDDFEDEMEAMAGMDDMW